MSAGVQWGPPGDSQDLRMYRPRSKAKSKWPIGQKVPLRGGRMLTLHLQLWISSFWCRKSLCEQPWLWFCFTPSRCLSLFPEKVLWPLQSLSSPVITHPGSKEALLCRLTPGAKRIFASIWCGQQRESGPHTVRATGSLGLCGAGKAPSAGKASKV
jgi:hypothetical protein